jgi:hypothetical protein
VFLRHATPTGAVGFLLLAAACFGYGGFEVTSTFHNVSGLNHRLDSLNREWNGTREFAYRSPLWWVGGHGGEHVGPVTLGGSGALSIWHHYQADSLESRLFAVRANFEVGFPYSPNEWVSVRPCVELGGNGLVVYAQTLNAGSKMWFAAWTVGAAPGVELMGSLPMSSESAIGLFVKGSYFIPISGPAWFGDKDPPAFSLSGFAIQIGLRFGKTAARAEDDLFNY